MLRKNYYQSKCITYKNDIKTHNDFTKISKINAIVKSYWSNKT